jgi:predicted DNA-binding transcriptional regulator AlpA
MTDQSPARSPDRLISEKSTAEILDISTDTLRRLGQRDEGPKRRKISPRRVGYKLSEVEAYRDGTCPPDDPEPASQLRAARPRSRV